jgi:serine/threonine-protein kinase
MDHPPPKLVKLLEDLGVATGAQVASVEGRARRLARHLPLLESVWVDALVQARRLTAWQSAEIRAGRGEQLRVGPFVLEQPVDWPDFAAAYRARQVDTQAKHRLVVFRRNTGLPDPLLRLEALASRAAELTLPGVSPIEQAGGVGDLRFCVSAWIDGISASEWMVHHGRFAPLAVLEIARQMATALAGLEKAGVCHGDLGPRGLLLNDSGQVVMLEPGLRAIVRPVEEASEADLRPEAYDYLAPERAAGGAPVTPTADLYSAACVWWHLLAGRAPRPGGNSQAKLHAVQSGRLPDLDRLVRGIPEPLAEAIAACTARDPGERPQSFARLASLLGPSDRAGRACLRRCVAGEEWDFARFDPFPGQGQHRRPRGVLPVAAAVLLAVVAATVGLVWQGTLGLTRKAAPQAPVATMARLEASPAAKPAVVPSGVVPTAHVASGTGGSGRLGAIAAESLQLTAGARIGEPTGRRLQIVVPVAGWRVSVEDVGFENVDFVWQASSVGPVPPETAMVRLEAGRADFRGCVFRVSAGPRVPVAIRWTHPSEEADSLLALPSGKLRLENCLFESIDAAVECRTRGPTALDFSNVLQIEGGPLVRAMHCPTAEESLRIGLRRTTLRANGGVLECRYGEVGTSPGPVVIQAVQSGLFPRVGSALIALSGPEAPARLLDVVQWTGQGSLVGLQSPIVVWQSPSEGARPVDDARLAISGVARSEVEFAGASGGGPLASQILRWQAPLRSPDPPGADVTRLPMAGSGAKGS